MSDPNENINRILSEAANNLRIPTYTAQLIMMVGAELLAQHNMIQAQAAEMRQQLQRCEDRESNLQKQIDRLKRIHGA